VLAGALLFASLHLYQSNEFSTLTGIFITTFSGAVLFAWVMSEWQHNLWVPVFLHFFMNLFWMMFSAGVNALGGWYANIFRAITIALIIVITILYKRRSGERMEINRETLWIKKRQTFQPDGNATSRILD
jgi:membrane protease YdiL (CAAX protease family)